MSWSDHPLAMSPDRRHETFKDRMREARQSHEPCMCIRGSGGALGVLDPSCAHHGDGGTSWDG